MKNNKIFVALSTILTSAILALSGETYTYAQSIPVSDNSISIQSYRDEQNKTSDSKKPSEEDTPELITYNDNEFFVPAVSTRDYTVSSDTYLPAKYDDISWMPAVRDQSPFGTCWAHASVGLAEYSILKQENIQKDFSEFHLAYFAYNDSDNDPLGGTEGDITRHNGENNTTMHGGNYPLSMMVLSGWKGLVDEETAPYPTGIAYEDASTYNGGLDAALEYTANTAHIRNAYMINIKENPEQVKEMIIKYGAVGIDYYDDSGKYDDTYNSYNGTGATDTNHGVMIVGYDDTFPKENFGTPAASDGAWLIRNSWGTNDYSHNGYFWMSYDERSIGDTAYVFDCVSNQSNDYYDNNYQYDGGCAISTISSPRIRTANVFTVQKEYESLEAVSFITYSANVNYTVKIYKNPSDLSKLDEGELIAEKSGETIFAGMYNIKLDEAVLLQKNDVYAVAVELSKSDGSNVEMCLEYNSYGNVSSSLWSNCNAKEKQSFYFNNIEWTDSGIKYNGNFRIKAYTNDVKIIEIVKATDQKDGYIITARPNYDAQQKKTIISRAKIELSSTSFKYNGKTRKPTVTVTDADGRIISTANYTITFPKKLVNAGKYYVTINFKGSFYQGNVKKAFKITKISQPLKLSPSKKSYKAAALKKTGKAFTIKVKKNKGKVTFKSSNKNITVNKKGNVTIKKGIKKGNYTITVKAKGTANYKPVSKKIKITIK